MELVDGKTLREWFRGALPLERSLGIARQVLEALSTAHRAGVVHRDLKPENVMVRADGYVKVLDFGLAKWLPTTAQLQAERTTMHVTQPGQILGTVAYMSPEQIQGQDVDARSDLFAFGILLYEMLTRADIRGHGPQRWIRCTRSSTTIHRRWTCCRTEARPSPPL